VKYNETLNTLAKCFDEIESLMAIVSERLRGSNIPAKALFVERWPIETSNQAMYRIWDGFKHTEPLSGCYAVPAFLTVDDILEIVKRREILMREF
jgi:hypothetical protein